MGYTIMEKSGVVCPNLTQLEVLLILRWHLWVSPLMSFQIELAGNLAIALHTTTLNPFRVQVGQIFSQLSAVN